MESCVCWAVGPALQSNSSNCLVLIPHRQLGNYCPGKEMAPPNALSCLSPHPGPDIPPLLNTFATNLSSILNFFFFFFSGLTYNFMSCFMWKFSLESVYIQHTSVIHIMWVLFQYDTKQLVFFFQPTSCVITVRNKIGKLRNTRKYIY